MPNVEDKHLQETRESFLNYISEDTVVFTQSLKQLATRIDTNFVKAKEAFTKLSGEIKHSSPEELFSDSKQITRKLLDFTLVELENSTINLNKSSATPEISFNQQPQPSFNKQFDLLIENLNENAENGYRNYIFASASSRPSVFTIFLTMPSNRWHSMRR